MAKDFLPARGAFGGALPFFSLLPVIPLYYALLVIIAAGLTTGTLSLLAPVENGTAFNSMLGHLLQGDFDVDPDAIGWEGFVRDGKTYSYFGVFVAFLRLPLLLSGGLATTDITGFSCLVAASILAACQLGAIAMVWRTLPDSALRRLLAGVLVVATLLSGPEVAFLRPSIYQEVVLWANAIAAGFVCCAVYGVFVRGCFAPGLLSGMALIAGLCLNTRVSTAIGLYAATGLLLLRAAWLGARRVDSRGSTLLALLAPAAVLAISAGACALVNYERWGNPLVFNDLQHNLIYQYLFPDRLVILAQHGTFNPARIGYALLYYLVPAWAIPAGDGALLFSAFRHRFFDSVELPPAGLLLTDPLLVGMAALGVVAAWCWRRRAGVDTAAIGLIAAGLAMPMLLMLMFISLSYRYRGEFYPLLEFLACAGFFFAASRPTPRTAAPPHWIRGLALAGCAASVMGTHVALALYDLSPFGTVDRHVRDGAIADFYAGRIALLTGPRAEAPARR